MLAMAFRVGEGVIGGVTVQRSLGLLRLAAGADSNAPDSLISNALGALFLSDGGLGLIGALFFAMGMIKGVTASTTITRQLEAVR
jgi:hypothetical protein